MRKRVMTKEDHIVKMVMDAHEGNADKLASELDAMRGFLRMWEGEFKEEGDDRMALICDMLSTLFTIVATEYFRLSEESKKGGS